MHDLERRFSILSIFRKVIVASLFSLNGSHGLLITHLIFYHRISNRFCIRKKREEESWIFKKLTRGTRGLFGIEKQGLAQNTGISLAPAMIS